MDGLFLGFVTRELQDILVGARVDRVLQPEKDELHLLLRNQGTTHRLLICASVHNQRVHLTQRAKPNPVEPPVFCMLLRKQLGTGYVSSIEQIDGDRVLEITFACRDDMGDRTCRILSCELMGRNSNIILRDDSGRILDAIRHVGADINHVREIKPGVAFVPPPSQQKLNPALVDIAPLRDALLSAGPRLDKAIADTLTGISLASAKEIAYRLTAQESPYLEPEARAKIAAPLHALLQAMPGFGPPVILRNEHGEAIDLLPFAQRRFDAALQQEMPQGPSAALDSYYMWRDQRDRMAQKSSALARTLRTRMERCENKLALHEDILASEARAEEARIRGELLTANLHLIQKGQTSVEVPDYYTGGIQKIALDERLSPALNAQKYYKQYQKMRAAQKHAKEQIEQIRQELTILEAQLDDLRKCQAATEIDEIREELVRMGFLRTSHSRKKQMKQAPSKPMQCVSSDGISIRIGKNSAQNDRLTASAPPEATWLHAKNMAGSHVVVDCEGDPPTGTLREAAQLAAWFSRGYRSAQVPVDYTLRKYVKKPSGAALGFVVYTHQRTLYVTPDEATVKRLMDAK